MDAHFATKSELFVVKKGSLGAKKELFGERILLQKRDYLVQINCLFGTWSMYSIQWVGIVVSSLLFFCIFSFYLFFWKNIYYFFLRALLSLESNLRSVRRIHGWDPMVGPQCQCPSHTHKDLHGGMTSGNVWWYPLYHTSHGKSRVPEILLKLDNNQVWEYHQ